MNILKELIDKNLIEILDLFLNNPDKKFSLTEVSRETKVNVTGTFRIIKSLVLKKFIKPIPIGKTKLYILEKNEKTEYLLKLLEKDITPIEKFIEEISRLPDIIKIILNSKEKNIANLLIVSKDTSQEKIQEITKSIKEEYNFTINFAIITEIQYESFKKFKNYNIDKNIIWEKKK
jgi:hypothetical protein